jgi:hypothetical protein
MQRFSFRFSCVNWLPSDAVRDQTAERNSHRVASIVNENIPQDQKRGYIGGTVPSPSSFKSSRLSYSGHSFPVPETTHRTRARRSKKVAVFSLDPRCKMTAQYQCR